MKTVNVGNGRFQMQQHRVCKKCQNYKMVTETKELDVEVEIGMQDGHEIPCVPPPAYHNPSELAPLVVGSGGIAADTEVRLRRPHHCRPRVHRLPARPPARPPSSPWLPWRYIPVWAHLSITDTRARESPTRTVKPAT